jgi:hypothetical protein
MAAVLAGNLLVPLIADEAVDRVEEVLEARVELAAGIEEYRWSGHRLHEIGLERVAAAAGREVVKGDLRRSLAREVDLDRHSRVGAVAAGAGRRRDVGAGWRRQEGVADAAGRRYCRSIGCPSRGSSGPSWA